MHSRVVLAPSSRVRFWRFAGLLLSRPARPAFLFARVSATTTPAWLHVPASRSLVTSNDGTVAAFLCAGGHVARVGGRA
jgi:hypothetical protein